MSRRLLAIAGLLLLFTGTAAAILLLWPREDDGSTEAATPVSEVVAGEAGDDGLAEALGRAADGAPANGMAEPSADPDQVAAYAVSPAGPPYPVRPRLEHPPSAGLLFDVDTGEVLWARRPGAERPIASLTKMMTALVIAERHRPRERVLISPKAPGVEGSRIGVLRPGRKVPLGGLFLGLLMVSGNDAAAALAEHDAGTIRAFVRRMNARAAELGLACTRFAGPAGLQDTGNASCAYDLATLARAALDNPEVASTVRRRFASVPFPVKGGRLELANNHFFVQRGVAGVRRARVTGVKTGLTNAAGRCYVTTARLGNTHLGVVLLDSPDPITQVPLLLRAGFRAGL
jgi:D-alanyl-D-alanine carboxypeptidase (penicillin-binding protein 5/6)